MEHKAEARALQSLMNLAGGCVVSRCTHVVAELGVADAFDGSPLSAAELADAVGANPTALYRVMSLRAGHGIFTGHNEKFEHTPASRFLRTDHPHSMRPFVRMMGLTATWSSYGQLMHSLRTGQPAAAELLSWQKLRDVDCGHELWTQPHPTLRRFGSRVPKTNVHDSVMGTRVADRFFGSSMTAVSAGRTVR